MTKASDDLADALYEGSNQEMGLAVVSEADLRTLAREAEAMGAKQSEDQIVSLQQQLSGARKLALLSLFAAESIGGDDVLAFAEEEKKRIEAMGAKKAGHHHMCDSMLDDPEDEPSPCNCWKSRAEQIGERGE